MVILIQAIYMRAKRINGSVIVWLIMNLNQNLWLRAKNSHIKYNLSQIILHWKILKIEWNIFLQSIFTDITC